MQGKNLQQPSESLRVVFSYSKGILSPEAYPKITQKACFSYAYALLTTVFDEWCSCISTAVYQRFVRTTFTVFIFLTTSNLTIFAAEKWWL
jgi:hypothetical protein